MDKGNTANLQHMRYMMERGTRHGTYYKDKELRKRLATFNLTFARRNKYEPNSPRYILEDSIVQRDDLQITELMRQFHEREESANKSLTEKTNQEMSTQEATPKKELSDDEARIRNEKAIKEKLEKEENARKIAEGIKAEAIKRQAVEEFKKKQTTEQEEMERSVLLDEIKGVDPKTKLREIRNLAIVDLNEILSEKKEEKRIAEEEKAKADKEKDLKKKELLIVKLEALMNEHGIESSVTLNTDNKLEEIEAGLQSVKDIIAETTGAPTKTPPSEKPKEEPKEEDKKPLVVKKKTEKPVEDSDSSKMGKHEAIIHDIFTSGKTKVTAEELNAKGFGVFWSKLTSKGGTFGKYVLSKSWASSVYEISEK